jgi:hypothetical protein
MFFYKNNIFIIYINNFYIKHILKRSNVARGKENLPPTSHEIYRTSAAGHIQKEAQKMKKQLENRNKKRNINNLFQNGTYVRIRIPSIDRSSTDRKALPCKIVDVLPNDQYRLGCATGIINRCYSANEMELMGSQEFSELENIPNISVGVREAALAQSASINIGVRCNCHTKCDQKRCKCKKSGVVCGSNCHPSNSRCINRDE